MGEHKTSVFCRGPADISHADNRLSITVLAGEDLRICRLRLRTDWKREKVRCSCRCYVTCCYIVCRILCQICRPSKIPLCRNGSITCWNKGFRNLRDVTPRRLVNSSDVEYPSWRVYTGSIFQFLREESVTTNTFLCFVKNYLATEFRHI
jgi:hypothetical protein